MGLVGYTKILFIHLYKPLRKYHQLIFPATYP